MNNINIINFTSYDRKLYIGIQKVRWVETFQVVHKMTATVSSEEELKRCIPNTLYGLHSTHGQTLLHKKWEEHILAPKHYIID